MLNLRQIIKLYPIINKDEINQEVKDLVKNTLQNNILLSKDECIYIASFNDLSMIENLFEQQNISNILKESIFIYYLNKKQVDFLKILLFKYNVSLNNKEILHYIFFHSNDYNFIIQFIFDRQIYKQISDQIIFYLLINFDFKEKNILVDYLIKHSKNSFENYFYDLFEKESDITKALNFYKQFPLFNLETIYEKLSSYPIKEGAFESSYFNLFYLNFPIDLSFNHNLLLQNSLIILNEELINFLVTFDSVIENIDEKFIKRQKNTYNYEESKIFLEEIIIRYKLKNF